MKAQIQPGSSLDIGDGARENSLATMARGWGRSEEDQPGDKEQDREGRSALYSPPPRELERLRRRRSIEMSLARIEEQLSKMHSPERRKALESARSDLRKRLTEL